MATRQLLLKRGVYDTKKKFKEVKYGDLFMDDTPLSFKEVLFIGVICSATVSFGIGDKIIDYLDSNGKEEEELMDIGFEICCVSYMSSLVQYIKKENRELINKPLYTFLTKEVLPEMWKDRKEIELRRQRKLENLSKLLDKDERYQEAHIIRIIVKPYLEEMNRKWTNMTALEKFKSLIL